MTIMLWIQLRTIQRDNHTPNKQVPPRSEPHTRMPATAPGNRQESPSLSTSKPSETLFTSCLQRTWDESCRQARPESTRVKKSLARYCRPLEGTQPGRSRAGVWSAAWLGGEPGEGCGWLLERKEWGRGAAGRGGHA